MQINQEKLAEIRQASDALAIAWNKFATYQILPAVRTFDQNALSAAFADIFVTVIQSIPDDI